MESIAIFQNYRAFGLEAIHDVDCGDFLRGLLFETGSDLSHNPNEVKELAFLHLEWKFECPKCHRFMTMSLKDYVMKIKVSQEKSLEKLIHDFTETKACPCGQVSKVAPTVKKLSKYIFIEIDRSISSGKSNNRLESNLCLQKKLLQDPVNLVMKHPKKLDCFP